MLNKTPVITIGKDPWQNDDLNFKDAGLLLTKLIHSLHTPYVIAVKGEWGAGKTTFLRRLERHLENALTAVVFVDAWKTDYTDDPLLPFAHAIDQKVHEKSGAEEKTNTIGSLAKAAVKLGAPITKLAVSLTGIAGKEVYENAALVLQTAGDMLLAQQNDRKDAIDQFEKELEDARDTLTGRQGVEKPKQLVMIIDELDRCRPPYAICVLERIKHYFGVTNIVFVIATDGSNLPAAVQSVYGASTDGRRYLRKFFDFEFTLPKPPPSAFAKSMFVEFKLNELTDNAKYTYEKLTSSIEKPESGYQEALAKCPTILNSVEALNAVIAIGAAHKVALRDQALIFNAVNCYCRIAPAEYFCAPRLLALAECARFLDEPAYIAARDGNLEPLRRLASSSIKFPGFNSEDFEPLTQSSTRMHEVLNRAWKSNSTEAHKRNAALRRLMRLEGNKNIQVDDWLSRALGLTSNFNSDINEVYLDGLRYPKQRGA